MDEQLIEMDEEYDDDSTDMEDEDELNHRIQTKATHSPNQIDFDRLTRSVTEPPGDLAQFQTNQYKKPNPKKQIKYKNQYKNKNNIHAMDKLTKTQSLHQYASYNKDNDIGDIDVLSVEDDNPRMIITEDDVYLDMSVTTPSTAASTATSNTSTNNNNNNNNNNIPRQKQKRSSTLDLVKSGILSAKNRLLSPPQELANGSNLSNGNHGNNSPPSNTSSTDSPHYDRRKKSGSDSLNKKGSSLFSGKGLLSKGKELFGRSGSINYEDDDNKQYDNDVPHKKSASKTNLSSFKAKFQNIKKSNKNIPPKPPSHKLPKLPKPPKPPKSQNTERKSSKKKKSKKDKDKNKNKNKNKETSNGKIKASNKQMRKRSSSQNNNKTSGGDRDRDRDRERDRESGIRAPPKRGSHMKAKDNSHLKRHSMQAPVRSRSQKPNTLKPGDNGRDRRMQRNKSEANPEEQADYNRDRMNRKSASHVDLKLRNKANSDHGSASKKKHSKESKEREKEREKEEMEKSMILADKKCKFRIKNEIFELYEYYKPIRLIGSGAYAVVCEAIDERTKKRVAIKKNKHIFDDIRDARRILREIKLLLHYNRFRHPDLIEIYDSLPPIVSEIQTFEDVYIVMPLLESNLCKIITSKQKLSNLHYQYLTYQVLRGLAFIHESGVIHRDIKPENILLNGSDCDVKIIDFGLARGVLGKENSDNPENAKATEYVCTRWYRSPEVMCSGGRYDEKMDIWGVGCILAEMILRRPLFPGANYLDQLQQIFDVMGTPKSTEWILNDQARNWVIKLPKHNGKNIRKMIKHKFDENNCTEADLENCTDLLYKLLALDPGDRISAQDSLKHAYFKEMHDEDEIMHGDKFDLSFEFEQSIKTKFGVRHMMYTALDQYHKKQWIKITKKKKRKAQKEKNKKKDRKDKHHKKHKHKSSSKPK